MVAQGNTTTGAILGFDFAGVVDQLGSNVTTEKAQVGQRVSGMA
jgi:NADPH:quinone reductase-like Zn-dependent oxidoreductase